MCLPRSSEAKAGKYEKLLIYLANYHIPTFSHFHILIQFPDSIIQYRGKTYPADIGYQ